MEMESSRGCTWYLWDERFCDAAGVIAECQYSGIRDICPFHFKSNRYNTVRFIVSRSVRQCDSAMCSRLKIFNKLSFSTNKAVWKCIAGKTETVLRLYLRIYGRPTGSGTLNLAVVGFSAELKWRWILTATSYSLPNKEQVEYLMN